MSDSTPRWIPSQFDQDELHRFQWSNATGGGVVDHVVEFHAPETFEAGDALCINVLRAMCHALVDRLPNEAIDDLAEVIADLLRFYFQQRNELIEDATKRHRVSARISTTREKEAFTISDD